MRAVSIVCSVVCAACVTTGSGAGGPAQAVADIDRALKSSVTVSESARAGLLERQGQVVDAWLREQLTALGSSSTDQAVSQVQQIIAEADRRGRPAVAAEAERVEGTMLEQRTPELDMMIAKGQWLEALELVSRLTEHSRASSPGPTLKSRVVAEVRQKVAQAEAAATTVPERFLYARMHAWVAEPVTPGPAVDEVAHLTTTNPALDWSGSSCTEAQSITLPASASGTSAAVHVTLGGCEVARRTSTDARNMGFTVQVQRQQQETYYESVDRIAQVTGSERVCSQVSKKLDARSESVLVTECSEQPTTKFVSVTDQIPHTRMVTVTDTEPRTERVQVTLADSSVSLPITVTVTGDEQSITVSDRLTASDHDEQYTSSNVGSRSFRSNTEQSLKRGLGHDVERFVKKALGEWAHARATARLAKARETPAMARALAVEAVALDPTAAEESKKILGLTLPAASLVALVSGTPRVEVGALPAGGGLPLPPPSASVEAEYAELEAIQARQVPHGDLLIAIGGGVQPTPDNKSTGAVSMDLNFGVVPGFAAAGLAVLRAGVDLQFLLSTFFLGDADVRPEAGLRLGPVELSATGVGGVRLANEQTVVDSEDDTRLRGTLYAGYGAHLALHLGPVLLDALALRLHQLNGHAPIAVRGDAMLGVALNENLTLAAHFRYVAQTDLRAAFTTPDRYASLGVGVLLQY